MNLDLQTLGIMVVLGGALWKLSFQVSSVVTELRNIKELLKKSEDDLHELGSKVNNHSERITTLEEKIK